MFRHHRDAIPVPRIVPPRVRTVLLLQSAEELQSAIERARAFQRRDARERPVRTHDRCLNMLADIVRMPPEDTGAEARIAGVPD